MPTQAHKYADLPGSASVPSSSGPPKVFGDRDLLDVPEELLYELRQLEDMFVITQAELKRITNHFAQELEKGLTKDGGNIPMNVAWVFGFPNGNERGKFITLDMGGTNLRVCEVKLTDGKGKHELLQDKFPMPEGLKASTADKLWGFVAECTAKFINDHRLSSGEVLPLSFTFSFPVTQSHINSGILQRWTKGFDVAGVEGQDVVPQLQSAFDERNVPVKIIAVVNDTTRTLVASRYRDPAIRIGSIFSTGVNAAYMESCGEIPKMKGWNLPPDCEVAINTEYGAFDNDRKLLPRTQFDRIIDEDSPRPGQQLYEKMVAGLYIGEILRLVFLDLHQRHHMFRGQDVSLLRQRNAIDSLFLSTIEEDRSEALHDISFIFNQALGIKPTSHELKVAQYLTELIATRSARLYSCGIAAICLKKAIKACHVGVDGSVFNKYSHFRDRAAQALKEICDWPADLANPISLHSAEDGSGVGAALIAALVLERSKGSAGKL